MPVASMEELFNFYQTQTPFGVLSLVLFFGLLAFYLRKLAKRESPSALLSAAVLLPLLFYSLAAMKHLLSARNALERDTADILNPVAGIQLASELLWGGCGMSLILGVTLGMSVLVTKSAARREQSSTAAGGDERQPLA